MRTQEINLKPIDGFDDYTGVGQPMYLAAARKYDPLREISAAKATQLTQSFEHIVEVYDPIAAYTHVLSVRERI